MLFLKCIYQLHHWTVENCMWLVSILNKYLYEVRSLLFLLLERSGFDALWGRILYGVDMAYTYKLLHFTYIHMRSEQRMKSKHTEYAKLLLYVWTVHCYFHLLKVIVWSIILAVRWNSMSPIVIAECGDDRDSLVEPRKQNENIMSAWSLISNKKNIKNKYSTILVPILIGETESSSAV